LFSKCIEINIFGEQSPSGNAARPRRDDQRKEGHGEPKGVRLTARTDSEGANPKDGAGMEKARQVTVVGAKRFARGAKHATSRGRRLNKPLSTESTQTLDVERESRAGKLANAVKRSNF
jgi:hypothetical protein